MRVLVCGDRRWADRTLPDGEPDHERNAAEIELLATTLTDVLKRANLSLTVIEGGAKGADTLAGDWARVMGAELIEVRADWRRYRRGAGPIRNQQMLDLGPELVVAFHPDLADSKGTADMVRRAEKAGVPVEVHP